MPLPDLHIIHFAVPYPADYGGAIDSWNRIRALRECGVKMNLHCFVYRDFTPQPVLKEVATGVHYYPRQLWPALTAKGVPYIISSRKSPGLLQNLLKDRQPVLFEGIHTTGFLPRLTGRRRFLRAHNIEHRYYRELSENRAGISSLIYARESNCLEDYEKKVPPDFDAIFTISPTDQDWFAQRTPNALFLPPFHGCRQLTSATGRGEFLLYQGDLSIEINQVALLDLLRKLGPERTYPMVVAGRSGSRSFEQHLAGVPLLRREANVSGSRMQELIRQAQIIIIHTLHQSGMKVKIFPALYQGRFIMASEMAATHTSLDQALHFYSVTNMKEIMEKLWSREFSGEQLRERAVILSSQPDDLQKAREIIRYL